jgi:hypothetical protein
MSHSQRSQIRARTFRCPDHPVGQCGKGTEQRRSAGRGHRGMLLVAASGLCLGLLGPLPTLADVVAIAPGQADPNRLYLRTGEIDTSGGMVGLPALHRQIPAPGVSNRFVVQLDGPMTPERRRRMETAGIGIGPYLPMHAYIVTLDRAQAAAVQNLEFIRWYSEYQDQWKIDPDLAGPGAHGTPERQALAARGRERYTIVTFPGADLAAVQNAVWNIKGMAVTGWEEMDGPGSAWIELLAEGPLTAPANMAAIPGIQFIERAPEITERARNDRARWIIQSNQQSITPLYAQGLRGEGQIVGIMDTKIRQDHCSFIDSNPIGPNHRKFLAYNTTPGSASHGTHVAGTVAGDAGNETGNTRGIAYKSRIVYHEWPSFTESAMNERLMLHHGQGARIHTNSWGDDGTTAYNGLCRGIDLFSWNNEESLVLFAVTNGSLLKNPENAKNLLAVGASGSAGSQQNHCTAGAGPTSDGRRKPEIFAPGCGTESSSSTSACGTTSMTGTSMACPAVAGAALLVRQYYTDGFYPLGIPTPATALMPSSALLKATLLNSAVDMTGVPGYPSAAEGWGRVLADNALYFDGDARKLQIRDVRKNEGLSTGQVVEFQLPVLGAANPAEPLRITMAYTEPPATANASFASVNDLDLEVVDPVGQTYKGNVFNTVAGFSQLGGAKDDRNNVEQVHIENPQAGVWTVRIRAAAVNEGVQGYALVMTGDIAPAQPPPLIIGLTGPAPTLIAPAEVRQFQVRIVEGSQSLVAGSPRLHHRASGSGAYQELPLTPISGDLYEATIPAPVCGDEPQFYVSAVADNSTVVTFPGAAPVVVLSAEVGVLDVQTIFAADFGSAWPAGWSATGLWNLSAGCAPGSPPPGTACGPAPWAYYGNLSTCTYQTGSSANVGGLMSPMISLPAVAGTAGGELTLSFCSALQTENNASFDRATIRIAGQELTRLGESADWQTQLVNLLPYAGQNVNIEWHFDTRDGYVNDRRGWHVDQIRITATVVTCQQPACYANCDLSTTAPVLNIDDFTCFINQFALAQNLPHEQQVPHYANCDGSQTAPALNIDDFTCFINQFALGCP